MERPSAAAALFAWMGGLLFVASLGIFLWSYLVGFDRLVPGESIGAPLVVDVVLFSVFALHHSLFARSGAKAWLTSRVSARLERPIYVWAASLLFVGACLGWQALPGTVYRHTGTVAMAHWMAVAVGIWMTARSAALIDPLELAGIREPDLTATDRFVVAGPYRVVRHPIYLGWVLLVFGVPYMTTTRLAFAIVSTAYLVAAIPFEERSLITAFGETYRRYQRTVRWRLLPGVW